MTDFSALVFTLEKLAEGKSPRPFYSGTKITACYKDLAKNGFIAKSKGKYEPTEKGRELLALVRKEKKQP